MGEYISEDVFRVVDLTIQNCDGGISFFIRQIEDVVTSLFQFFLKTGKQYQRFNYLGEWHSHPSFSTYPSSKDLNSMFDIINDRNLGANFVVLIILKLGKFNELQGSALVFVPGRKYFQCELALDGIN